MMSGIARSLVACVGILWATNAAAQNVVYFGRVTGSDQVGAVPGDWSVNIALKRKADAEPFLRTSSEGDLFACTAPANAEVQIVASKDGYEGQIFDLPAVKDAARVRPDLVLERITPQSVMRIKDPGDFERRLKMEADVARFTGRTDVFEMNIERYKQAATGRADLSAVAQRFETSASYQAVIKDPDAPRIPKGAVRHLIGAPGVVTAPDEQLALLEVVQNERLSVGTRRNAIKALSGVKDLPADVQSRYLDALRQWSRSPDSALFGAATSALATRGTPGDQQEVVRVMKGATSATQIRAIESFQGSLPAPAERAVTDVVTTTQDPDVKVTSLKALKGSANPETMKVVVQQTAPTEAAAVRMEAVTVLGSAPATPETTNALSKIAKTDASAEVRAAAAAALAVKKPQ